MHCPLISIRVRLSGFTSSPLEVSTPSDPSTLTIGLPWQPKDHVRLVFHATFKRFSREEVQSIKGLLSELGEYDVEYAFVQLSEQHPYMLFDTSRAALLITKSSAPRSTNEGVQCAHTVEIVVVGREAARN
jgi:hypothetical protein